MDMEEEISKFMEGMESEECNGYNTLHKLLQTLPVPEEKDSERALALGGRPMN